MALWVDEERPYQGVQKGGDPSQEEMEVEARGGEDSVDSVAGMAFEVVAAHAVFGLEMADDGLDGGAALHLALDGGGGSADLTGDPDAELVRVVVATIALIDMDALDLDAGVLLGIGDGAFERMARTGCRAGRVNGARTARPWGPSRVSQC